MSASRTYTESQLAEFEQAWRLGRLEWLLHDGQLALSTFVDSLRARLIRRGVVKSTRRYGKTYFNAVKAISRCISKPNLLVPFVAPTVKANKTIVRPIFSQVIAQHCPPDLRPVYKVQDGCYVFSNNSQIPLVGTDNGNAERMRGIKADDIFLDEAAFMSDLEYIVNDIATPALMYGDGMLLASSTPPPSSGHYFVQMLQDAELKAAAFMATVWDNPLLTVKQILDFAEVLHCEIEWDRYHKEMDGSKVRDMEWGKTLLLSKSVAFRREFEAEILTDPEKAVVPEFTAEREARIVGDWPTPPRFIPYTIIDTGFIDFTAVVFGYWDFRAAKAVVQDDLLIDFRGEGENAESLAGRIKAKEESIWGRPAEHRFGDGDLIVLHELTRHGLTTAPVKKDELEAQVNSLRTDCSADKLRICPAARNVIAHMKYGVWDKQRRKFDRSPVHGHYDALAAVMYFVRHINRSVNPYPADYGVTDHYNQVYPGDWDRPNTSDQTIKEIFTT